MYTLLGVQWAEGRQVYQVDMAKPARIGYNVLRKATFCMYL